MIGKRKEKNNCTIIIQLHLANASSNEIARNKCRQQFTRFDIFAGRLLSLSLSLLVLLLLVRFHLRAILMRSVILIIQSC